MEGHAGDSRWHESQSISPGGSETQMALARGLGHTLLSTAGAEYRARQLEGLPELLGE